MLKTRKLASLLFAFTLSSCGGDDETSNNSNSPKINDNLFSFVGSGDNLQVSDNKVSGRGALIFNDPLKEEDNSYTFSLSLEESGSLELITNSDKELKNGVILKFSRKETILHVLASVGTKTIDITDNFKSLDASTTISFVIDVHNESPAHVVIWSGASKLSEENALFNSEEDQNMPGQSSGNFWGFRLESAKVESPKADHAHLHHHHH